MSVVRACLWSACIHDGVDTHTGLQVGLNQRSMKDWLELPGTLAFDPKDRADRPRFQEADLARYFGPLSCNRSSKSHESTIG